MWGVTWEELASHKSDPITYLLYALPKPLHYFITALEMSSVFFYEPFYDFERLAEKLISQQQQQQQQQEKLQQQHDSKGLVARQQVNSVDGAVRLRRPK